MEELDVRLRLHGEVGLQLRTLGEERDVPVEYINLLPLLAYEGDAAPDGEPADDGTASYGGQHRHHGEFRFLCKGFYKHILSF